MAEYPYSVYQPQGIPYAKQIATTKKAPYGGERQGQLNALLAATRRTTPDIDLVLDELRNNRVYINPTRAQTLQAIPSGHPLYTGAQESLGRGWEVMGPEERQRLQNIVSAHPGYEGALESVGSGLEVQSPNIIAAAQAQVEAQEKPFEQFRGETQAIIPDIQKKYADYYQKMQEAEAANLANIDAESAKQESDIRNIMAARGIRGSTMEEGAQTQRIGNIARLRNDVTTKAGLLRGQFTVDEAQQVGALQQLIARSRIDQATMTFNQFDQEQVRGLQQWVAQQTNDINLKQLGLDEFNSAINNSLKRLQLESELMGLGQNPLYSLSS